MAGIGVATSLALTAKAFVLNPYTNRVQFSLTPSPEDKLFYKLYP
jgi:hypothetical protein